MGASRFSVALVLYISILSINLPFVVQAQLSFRLDGVVCQMFKILLLLLLYTYMFGLLSGLRKPGLVLARDIFTRKFYDRLQSIPEDKLKQM